MFPLRMLDAPTAEARALRAALPILLGAAAMLSVGMGLRQSLGLFMPKLTHDIAITISDFTLAVAVQNLAWGFLQPVAGALVVRAGFRSVMLIGAALYAAGLLLLATAQGLLAVMIGAGLLIGTGLACTGSAIALAVASRVVPAATRSMVLGLVSWAACFSAGRAGTGRSSHCSA